MSINGNRLYLFGDFSFDPEERVLLRGGKALPLTPKTLELLAVLIGNHGRIVEKEVLMSEIWAGSFVEDSNLTFTVRQLRKALADDARTPTYIETVPRRGYRFIGEVREFAGEAKAAFLLSETSLPPAEKEFAGSKSKNFHIPLIAAVVFLIGAVALGGWLTKSVKTVIGAPVLNAPFSAEKLSTDSKVLHAVVSPDGKNVVYTSGFKDRQSVWLRQLETANSVEIIPPSDDFYYGLAMSPDGNFLYFARKPKYSERQADIYRVSIFGGVPQLIVSDTQGWLSVSNDGAKISFVRCFYLEDENCSLWIADASDGKNERKLVSRPQPFRIGDNRISPDGRTVAFAAGQSKTGANEFGLMEVDIETGAERELTAQKFFNIKSLVWLPDGGGLLVAASRIPNKAFRIWQISAATGDAQPMTKDSENYATLSLDKSANVLVSTQVKNDFQLRLHQTENLFAVAPRVLASAATVAFAPNGKIIYSSAMTGNSEIWSVNPDGGEQRQLTNNAADDLWATVSPNDNSIFFASNRTGEMHVWRMNADGSNQTQITKTEGGFPLRVSPDKSWVYYSSALQKTLRRVSVEDGTEETVLDSKNHHFAVSANGLYAAYAERQAGELVLTVVSLDDKRIVKTFKAAGEKTRLIQLAWSPDGKTLAYVSADGEFKNNHLWLQPIEGERSPRQIADLGDGEISEMSGFALAPDRKSFAVVQGDWRHDAVLLKGLK